MRERETTDDVSCQPAGAAVKLSGKKDCIRTELWKAAYAAPKVQYRI
jgi:hypothetical protein